MWLHWLLRWLVDNSTFNFWPTPSVCICEMLWWAFLLINICAYVAVTGRKRTLFHWKWLYWNHSRFSVSLYECLNSMHSKFQSHSYWQSIAVWVSITPPTLMFVFYLWLPCVFASHHAYEGSMSTRFIITGEALVAKGPPSGDQTGDFEHS